MVQEPSKIFAGLSLKFNRDYGDYPPSEGYSLVYYLRGQDKAGITFTASSDGSQYTLDIPPSVTKTYAPGIYKLIAYAEKDDARRLVYFGDCQVFPDPTADGSDMRGTWTRIADAIEAKFEDKATAGQLDIVAAAFTTYSAQYNFLNLKELYVFAATMREKELNEEKKQSGLQVSTDINIQFA